MKRTVFLSLAVIAAAPAAALADDGLALPAVTYPALPETGGTIFDFIPPGWVMEAKAEGDLNRDGRDDVAGVLRMRDPANMVDNPLLGADPFDSNPRLLFVAFRLDGAHYRLVMSNHTLIPRNTIPARSDPFQSIAIERGVLDIGLEHFMSAGGWTMWNVTYHLRWRDPDFVLAAYDRREIARNTGAIEEISIDFLSRRRKIVRTAAENASQSVGWAMEPARPLRRLDEIGDGLEWHPDEAGEEGAEGQ